MFGVGRQEDASEFFTTLLESMIKSINYAATNSPAMNGFGKSEQHHRNDKKRVATILDDIFSFQFRSRGF